MDEELTPEQKTQNDYMLGFGEGYVLGLRDQKEADAQIAESVFFSRVIAKHIAKRIREQE